MNHNSTNAVNVTVLIWDAKAKNSKLVQASNVPQYASAYDADLRHVPLYAARTIDIDSLIFQNVIEFLATDSGLHKMSYFECSKHVLTGDLGFEFELAANDFDVKKTYECEAGLSREPQLLGSLVAHLHEDQKTRIMADIDWNIKLNEERKLKWKLQNRLGEAQHDLFWSERQTEGLEFWFANRLNSIICRCLANDKQKAAIVITVAMPILVARKYFMNLNGEKFLPDEDGLSIIEREGTWTTKHGGHCPKSYMMDTFNNSQTYAYKTDSYWYDFSGQNITYCQQTENLTFEAVKICAKIEVDSTAKRWRRV